MNKYIILIVAIVVVGLGVASAPGALTVLHEFTSGVSDGGRPMSGPVTAGGVLYGMTPFGGVSNFGTVYSLRLSDTNFTSLHAFTGPDGKYPLGGLLVSGTNAFGMTSRGGTNDAGVIFRIGTNGTGFAVLHHFHGTNTLDGAMPWANLIESGGVLYGMTYNGGITNRGVVFAMNANGTGYTNLHRFVGGYGDGKHPKGSLLLQGGRLYGMTSEGGSNNAGVVFALDTDGTDYTNLYEFTGASGNAQNPSGTLTTDGTWLYGVASSGRDNAGVAFCIQAAGGTLNFLRFFSGSVADGADPYGSLLRHDTKLYGVTRYGGPGGAGLLLSMGAAYTNQYTWPSGGEPVGDLMAIGDLLYGTTTRGGSANHGTLFRFDADTNDAAAAWCRLSWIDNGGFSSTLAGDANTDRMYVQHGWQSGAPDFAYMGYGLTPNADDTSWRWVALTNFGGGAGVDYEYTGAFGRASAGNYYVAAKFIKGYHVYFTKPPDDTGWNNWGDWNTALAATNRWLVMALTAPSNAYARFVDTNDIDVLFQPDGTHWVTVFRKAGDSPSFAPPADGTTYYEGDTYEGEGECMYRGAANLYADTGLVENTVYHYRLYTENYSYYSTGVLASASTISGRDDDGDQMPNQYEVDQSFDPGLTSDGVGDADGDDFVNWNEYVAGTDAHNPTSLLDIVEVRGVTNRYAVGWSSVGGKQYTLWRGTNLTSFSSVASNLAATAPQNTYTDLVGVAQTYYYRVQVQR